MTGPRFPRNPHDEDGCEKCECDGPEDQSEACKEDGCSCHISEDDAREMYADMKYDEASDREGRRIRPTTMQNL